MKSFLQKAAQTIMILPVLALGVAFLMPTYVNATGTPTTANCTNINVNANPAAGAECVKPTSANRQLFGNGGIFVTVTNILIFVIGAIAVIMLIIGGIRYTVSQGDQNAITGAKNTILYAIIGIVVAVLAYGAVQFVTSQLK